MAYEAVNTLGKVIDLIPPKVKKMVEEIYLLDGTSSDNTYYAAIGYKTLKNLNMMTHPYLRSKVKMKFF